MKKNMKKIVCILLGIYVLCWLLVILIDGCLVIGPVDSRDIVSALLLIGLLALMGWGDAALIKATRGWVRGIALAFALAMEALFLVIFLFFSFYFYTNPQYYPLYGPSGEVELVVCEEGWLFKSWGEFFWPAGPFLLRSTGVTYEARDSWPFGNGYYELEWEEDQAVIRYNTGMGYWETCTVPRNGT